MKEMTNKSFRLLFKEEAGATATEYAIMLVLIILVAFASIVFLGQKVDGAFNKFATMFANATN